ncbi:MAG: hypothetical protein P0S95_07940, partial [Rhabdochlamydiaceae bacterium]|nr:hypothetical protein [Candidatus Amphrikana amoebophyrae]MDN3505490.1 hypothetical protein [Candidatus Amphrikana amoebophyrae]
MKRTIALKLILTQDQSEALLETQRAFALACNVIVPFAKENRCWNQVDLHHLAYYSVKSAIPTLGSQMRC